MSTRGIRVWKAGGAKRRAVGIRRGFDKEDKILGERIRQTSNEKLSDSSPPSTRGSTPSPLPSQFETTLPRQRSPTPPTPDVNHTSKPNTPTPPSTSHVRGTTNPHSPTPPSASRTGDTPYPHSPTPPRSSSPQVSDKENDEDRQHDSSSKLGQSYDFAKAEEEEELKRMRETLLLQKQVEEEHRQLEEALTLDTEGEEQNRDSKEALHEEERNSMPRGVLISNKETEKEDGRNHQRKKMGSERPRLVLTWVERTTVPPDLLEANKDLRKAMAKATPPGTLYTICETYDTYQHGGLFPMMHVSDDSGSINKLLNGGAVLDKAALGDGLRVDQGVFEEVANVRLAQDSSSNTKKLMAVACFKSIDKKLNPTLVKEWKAWTGARAFLQDLILSGLKCSSVRFLTRLAPYTSNETFYYMLMTEIAVMEANDEATFVDALQRFRVERWFGYQTVYKKVE